MGDLTGRTSVITGGGTGIGLAIAQRLADEGLEVVLVGRRQPRLEEAVAAIGATPLRRVGTPDNVAAAYALISNDYFTGVVLPVDGGWTVS